MHAITKTVYIEDQYPGVVLGVIFRPRGLIQIDAPPSPEDSRAWRATLMNLNGGPERVLINLDAHPDRTLGARAMDCTVIAHEKAAQIFRTRPTTFKAQGDETGAEWEDIPGLGSVRWAPPEISFGQQLTLHWEGSPVLIESPRALQRAPSGCTLAEEKIVFVGRCRGQEPAALPCHGRPARLDRALNLLLGPAFKGYTIISSRGGVVNAQTIRSQLDFLEACPRPPGTAGSQKAAPEATENLVAIAGSRLQRLGRPPETLCPAPALRTAALLYPSLPSLQPFREEIA